MFRRLWRWLLKNKKWLFNGVGATIIAVLVGMLFKPAPPDSSGWDKAVSLLQDALRAKEAQIAFLQGEIEKIQAAEPSEMARELADKIPPNADPYALALKAIAQERFNDARKLLRQAQQKKELALADIYEARGQTEQYAGHYSTAAKWFDKALSLKPNDLALLSQAGVAFYIAGQYGQAEELYRRWLARKSHRGIEKGLPFGA